jgi:hypothetical protein
MYKHLMDKKRDKRATVDTFLNITPTENAHRNRLVAETGNYFSFERDGIS